MRVSVIAALMFGAAAPLPGQAPTRTALVVGAVPLSARGAAVSGASSEPIGGKPGRAPLRGGRAFGLRVGAGMLGAAVGLALGAVAGMQFLPRQECGDDPGLCEAVMGAAAGTVVGAALGAAAPALGSSCGFGRRASVGVAGAVLGAAAGFAAGAPIGAMLFTFPLGAGVGGAIGASRC